MISLLIAALALTTAEQQLNDNLPRIFEKAAAHYQALDAAAKPLMKDAEGNYRLPHGFKRDKRELDMRGIYWWTTGHFAGSFWYLYEATGNEFFKQRGNVWMELLRPVAKYDANHDIGFIMYCSYGNARRILDSDKYDELLVETAESLCHRYNPDLGLIRSWGQITNRQEFLVIPDNLMNLELLEFATTISGNRKYADIAESHADVTMKHHFRADGGCRHVLNYDQVTKRVMNIDRGQGASCETAWSRGQSWGIYGYTMMYRTSGKIRYLDFARKLADYAMNHPNMPKDGVPYWDYGAPGEERDSSAASCMASALLELSEYVDAANRKRYRAFAVKQLNSLASPEYFSEGDEIGHWLLKHGVGHKPKGSEIDTPLDYGDYYFLEALLRFKEILRRERELEGVASVLPTLAQLPEDEMIARCNYMTKSELQQERAAQALTNEIPEPTDALYHEFKEIGNRKHYEAPYFKLVYGLRAMLVAEQTEGNGRYLPRIIEFVDRILTMKSWVLPAHDYYYGREATFRGECLTTDLFSTEVGAVLACAVQSLGNRLGIERVQRIKCECERRVFGPVRREVGDFFAPRTTLGFPFYRVLQWVPGHNNWIAVCWDNVACAACGLIDDLDDRSFFVGMADRTADHYLESFSDDGYCSEGMGYWNYGYGHHLLTGRMLDKLTGGKFNFFRRPKQRYASAYARAYTLREGASPAFADGNGSVSEYYQRIVDEYWPDLPKTLPPESEFPIGQVWLCRDPEGLSVAFKGGYNAEHHNHNDIGSYYVMNGSEFVGGDPGGEVYTARTFSSRRYESKVINSYGHPVPVVGGKLQSTGREFAAKVVDKQVGGEVTKVVLDISGAYEVKTLKKLWRTFVYDRRARTFTIIDQVEFTEPTIFESPYVDFAKPNQVRPMIEVTGGEYELAEDDIDNPDRPTPHRTAVRFKAPVTAASIRFTYR